MDMEQAIKSSGLERREAEELLAFVLKRGRAHVVAQARDELKPVALKKYQLLCARRLAHEPFAYIVGSQPFLGRDFLVNEHTLIPRPETEGLVERAIEQAKRAHKSGDGVTIVDIGTGSGCIAVSAALACPFATILASDISKDTLTMARKNARRLGAKVNFVNDDLLGKNLTSKIATELKKNPKHHLIFVSNPPYIPSSEKKSLQPDVVKYEPSSALFAGPDGTRYITKMLQQIATVVSTPVGAIHESPLRSTTVMQKKPSLTTITIRIFIELDPSHAGKIKQLASELFPTHKISIETDLCGLDRYLIVV